LRFGDLTLRKWHYQTGRPGLVNRKHWSTSGLVNRSPGPLMTATINRDKAPSHDRRRGPLHDLEKGHRDTRAFVHEG
jgi:hypothetical protein